MSNGYTPKYPTGNYGLAEGAAVCELIESVASKHGHHTALTGGCLYGVGGRKDIDVIIYRRRDLSLEDMKKRIPKMIDDFAKHIDMHLHADYGFVKKFYMGTGDDRIPIDCMFPEEVYGDYPLDPIAVGDKGMPKTAGGPQQPLNKPTKGSVNTSPFVSNPIGIGRPNPPEFSKNKPLKDYKSYIKSKLDDPPF